VRRYFEEWFSPWRVTASDGSMHGLVTGYYEPLLTGARQAGKGRFPVYAVPDDLLTIDLGSVYPELKSMRLRGRLVGNKVVPYWSRTEIEQGQAPLAGKALAWVDDPIELFFLQIQGSGRIRLEDGSLLRVGYADQNGHPYKSIGKWLIDQGELQASEASMQGIQAWARANPNKLDTLLNTNPSYVFFRILPNAEGGPIGALGVPLTDRASVAIDPRHLPLGAPLYLATTRPNSLQPLNRLVMAQDTGGAIRGPMRIDYFWGFGPEAGALAGRMKQEGEVWLLWPKGSTPSIPSSP
jgi:membrane-bound lytic murein transglycosylase A